MKKIIILLISGIVYAQPPVAPTTGEQVGDPRGENTGEYNIRNSFELGYRFATAGGDFDMYRSTVNYTDGIRLLSSSLSIQSRDGHGRWFDSLQLNTQGLGNDPYESATLRVEKNRLYRYDMIWRLNDYYNPSLTIANGEHFKSTSRIWQDHDLTLFPQSNLKFFLGYSRNEENGPALTTIQLFDFRGDTFPLFADVRRQQNEYRVGGEINFLGFRLNVLRGWEDFKEDTPTDILASTAAFRIGIDGNAVPLGEPGDNGLNTLNAYHSSQPYHGTSPYWRVGLFREGKRFYAVNARFTYVAGSRNFIDNEVSGGSTTSGAPATRQILVFGDARRPAANGNLNVTLFPASFFTITNQTTVNNIRMQGNALFSEIDNGVAITPFIPFTLLGIRTIANGTDAELRYKKRFSVHTGYHYSDRRIQVIDGQQNAGLPAPAPPNNIPITQFNHQHAGTLGVRIRPVAGLTILADGEIGRADAPYTPISDRNYTVFRARAEYKRKTWRASVYEKTDYNTNSVSLTSYASRSRNFGADASWTPNDWFAIDAGYTKLHLNTLGGLDFFAAGQATQFNSLYISNIHTASLGARFSIAKKADVFVGYSHSQDVGDGRSTADGLPLGAGTATVLDPFRAVQTFPLKFVSPEARLSVRIHRQLRWNVGYQYYGYNEQFTNFQDFHAHTGYSSLLWSF
ncbi:MAG TPA: hypothetical protein VNX18_21775 [Bryobacteraceae bacterium]|nr:hypothetical protein [Bryobacteraceae bacterium]